MVKTKKLIELEEFVAACIFLPEKKLNNLVYIHYEFKVNAIIYYFALI